MLRRCGRAIGEHDDGAIVRGRRPSRATKSTGAHMPAKNASKVGPRHPQVVVLVGATGDLARRKLLPGLFHLTNAGFIPGCIVIGVSLDDIDVERFRVRVREALTEFSSRPVSDAEWQRFAANLDYVPLTAGATALREAVARAEATLGDSRRLHYLSVPPNAALSAVRLLNEA